jgi:hypothetical protein
MATQTGTGAIVGTLTKTTLEVARDACARASAAGREKTAADKERDACLGQVFFELGFANMDGVKALSPEEMAIAIRASLVEDCKLAPNAVGLFVIVQTSAGKYPKWKEEFLACLGPAEVGRVEGETAKQYSYAVVDVASAKPGAGVLLGAAPVKAGKKR